MGKKFQLAAPFNLVCFTEVQDEIEGPGCTFYGVFSDAYAIGESAIKWTKVNIRLERGIGISGLSYRLSKL